MRSNLITLKGRLSQALTSAKTGLRKVGARRSLGLSLLIICTVAVFSFLVMNTSFITVEDGGNNYLMRSFGTSTEEALAAFDIELSPHDQVETEKTGLISTIRVIRAFPVHLKVDGEVKTEYVTGGTVGELLARTGTALGQYDQVTSELFTPLRSDQIVTVQRVAVETIEQEAEIPFAVERIASEQLARGNTVTVREGETGKSIAVLRNTYVDGELSESTVLSENVIKEPVAKQVKYGVGGSVATSRGSLRYKQVLDVKATAYTYGDGGSWGDVTATGKKVRPGFIAVDPKVIPLGSRVYITYPDGSFMYGFAVAEDTGGGIKGNRIDLFFETNAECKQFGVRKAKVYVLE